MLCSQMFDAAFLELQVMFDAALLGSQMFLRFNVTFLFDAALLEIVSKWLAVCCLLLVRLLEVSAFDNGNSLRDFAHGCFCICAAGVVASVRPVCVVMSEVVAVPAARLPPSFHRRLQSQLQLKVMPLEPMESTVMSEA